MTAKPGENRDPHQLPSVLWAGLVLLLVLSPLPFGSNRPWAWSAMALWVFILLIGWAGALALGRAKLIWRKALALPLVMICLVVGWIVVSLLPGVGPPHPSWQIVAEQLGHAVPARTTISVDATLVALMRLLAYLSIFWLSLQLCRDPRRAEQLLIWVSWISLSYALYGLINYFAGNPHLLWYERWAGQQDVTASFVNRNHYATFAALGLLCAAALAVNAFRSAWRLSDRSQPRIARTIECLAGRPLLYYVVSLVIAMAWLQSHSRMGAVAGALGIIVMLGLMKLVGIIRSRAVLVVIALLLGFFVLQVSGAGTMARLSETSEIDRLPLFAIISEQIGSAPMTGSGYGTFAQAFPVYRDMRLPTTTIFTEAHNSYLELATELGVPATLLLVLAIFYCASLCLVAAFRRQRDRLFPVVAFAAAIVVGTHALMDFSLQIPAVAALFASLLGMGVAQSWSTEAA